MTDKKDKALKLALDAIDEYCELGAIIRPIEVRDAIREALAQPEQEPVAWLHNGKLHEVDPIDWATGPVTPLYTSPAKPWVGLTDEDYKELHLQIGPVYFYQDYGHAIEAKLKEKNT